MYRQAPSQVYGHLPQQPRAPTQPNLDGTAQGGARAQIGDPGDAIGIGPFAVKSAIRTMTPHGGGGAMSPHGGGSAVIVPEQEFATKSLCPDSTPARPGQRFLLFFHLAPKR